MMLKDARGEVDSPGTFLFCSDNPELAVGATALVAFAVRHAPTHHTQLESTLVFEWFGTTCIHTDNLSE